MPFGSQALLETTSLTLDLVIGFRLARGMIADIPQQRLVRSLHSGACSLTSLLSLTAVA